MRPAPPGSAPRGRRGVPRGSWRRRSPPMRPLVQEPIKAWSMRSPSSSPTGLTLPTSLGSATWGREIGPDPPGGSPRRRRSGSSRHSASTLSSLQIRRGDRIRSEQPGLAPISSAMLATVESAPHVGSCGFRPAGLHRPVLSSVRGEATGRGGGSRPSTTPPVAGLR